MAIKPAKMAVLGPNLKSDVPKYLELAKLTRGLPGSTNQRPAPKTQVRAAEISSEGHQKVK